MLWDSFKLGFVKFLTYERNLSKHHLHEYLLSETVRDRVSTLSTILKTLAIVTIHFLNKHDPERETDARIDTIELILPDVRLEV